MRVTAWSDVMNKRSGWLSSAPDFARGMSLALEFAGAVALFWFLGRLVDNWLGIAPWAQVVGAVIGWIGGILHVYYGSRRLQQRRARRDPGGPR